FDGRDLSSFYTWLKDRGRDTDPEHVFSVVDGAIRISGQEWGCLTTREEFENYRLTAEYRWGDKTWPPRANNARDTGLLLHSTHADGGFRGIWMPSIEVQIAEACTGDLYVVSDQPGLVSITCPACSPLLDGGFDALAIGNPVTIDHLKAGRV